MATYTRQSAASIITGAEVIAAPLNAEFNQLQAAFHATTGHTHSGATGDGPLLPLTSFATLADMRVIGNTTGTTATPTAVVVLDEDNMATNSATALATQQSIKAYADTMLTKVGGTMSGAIAMGTNKITGLGDPTLAQDAATKAYSDLKLALAGGTMSGDIAMGGTQTVTGLNTPSAASDAATKAYVDAQVAAIGDTAPAALDTLNELAAALGDDADFAGTMTTALTGKLSLSGGSMTGVLDFNSQVATNVPTPTQSHHIAPKSYVDSVVGSYTATLAAQTAAEAAQTGAETAETGATNAQTYAEEWANKAEDSLVSVAAGGDGSTEYSALHWAAKAAASAGSLTDKITGPASATDGSIPQWDGATGKLLKAGLAVGTSANNLVQLNGSAELPAISGANLTNLPASGSLILISTQTISTAVSAIQFTDVIDGTYDAYELVITDIVANTAGDEFRLQYETSGGTAVTANYRYALDEINTSPSQNERGSASSGHIVLSVTIDDADGISGRLTFFRDPGSVIWHSANIASTGTMVRVNGGGINTGGSTYTGLKFYMQVSTMTAGTISLYGVSK